MIGRLRGELSAVEGNLATVECGGVGYEATVPDDLALRLPAIGERVELFIRMRQGREEAPVLYGFGDRATRRLFDLLLRVPRLGPKVALAVIGAVGTEAAARAIGSGNPAPLTAASGVSARLAERIVVELGPAMAEETELLALGSAAPPPSADGELLEALAALGYRRAEAERAAGLVPAEGDLDARIVAALRLLKR